MDGQSDSNKTSPLPGLSQDGVEGCIKLSSATSHLKEKTVASAATSIEKTLPETDDGTNTSSGITCDPLLFAPMTSDIRTPETDLNIDNCTNPPVAALEFTATVFVDMAEKRSVTTLDAFYSSDSKHVGGPQVTAGSPHVFRPLSHKTETETASMSDPVQTADLTSVYGRSASASSSPAQVVQIEVPKNFESDYVVPAPHTDSEIQLDTTAPCLSEDILAQASINVQYSLTKKATPSHNLPIVGHPASLDITASPSSSSEVPQPSLALTLPAVAPEPTSSTPSKRRRRENSECDPLSQSDTPLNPKKRSRGSSKPPTPGRPFTISHNLTHTKLAQPFRSPLFQKSLQSSNTRFTPTALRYEDENSMVSLPSTPSRPVGSVVTPKPKQLSRLHADVHLPSRTPPGSGSKNTRAVSKPFKSPFKSPLSSLSSSTTRLPPSPNIQVLERKLQQLRRAVKIRADSEGEKLQELTTKWKTVGRDVAWEIWAVVREHGESDRWGTEGDEKSGFGGRSNWGWDDTNTGVQREAGDGFGGNWGFAESRKDYANHGEETMDESRPISPSKLEVELWKSIRKTTKKPMQSDFAPRSASSTGAHATEQSSLTQDMEVREEANPREIQSDNENEEEKESRPNTLGTMLREFGIADETLGWNEDEEDFVGT